MQHEFPSLLDLHQDLLLLHPADWLALFLPFQLQ